MTVTPEGVGVPQTRPRSGVGSGKAALSGCPIRKMFVCGGQRVSGGFWGLLISTSGERQNLTSQFFTDFVSVKFVSLARLEWPPDGGESYADGSRQSISNHITGDGPPGTNDQAVRFATRQHAARGRRTAARVPDERVSRGARDRHPASFRVEPRPATARRQLTRRYRDVSGSMRRYSPAHRGQTVDLRTAAADPA